MCQAQIHAPSSTKNPVSLIMFVPTFFITYRNFDFSVLLYRSRLTKQSFIYLKQLTLLNKIQGIGNYQCCLTSCYSIVGSFISNSCIVVGLLVVYVIDLC
jgi:hypothetical protein